MFWFQKTTTTTYLFLSRIKMVSTRAQMRKEIAEQVDMVDEACAAVQGMDLDGNSADTAATAQIQGSTTGKSSHDIVASKFTTMNLETSDCLSWRLPNHHRNWL